MSMMMILIKKLMMMVMMLYIKRMVMMMMMMTIMTTPASDFSFGEIEGEARGAGNLIKNVNFNKIALITSTLV